VKILAGNIRGAFGALLDCLVAPHGAVATVGPCQQNNPDTDTLSPNVNGSPGAHRLWRFRSSCRCVFRHDSHSRAPAPPAASQVQRLPPAADGGGGGPCERGAGLSSRSLLLLGEGTVALALLPGATRGCGRGAGAHAMRAAPAAAGPPRRRMHDVDVRMRMNCSNEI